MFKILPATEADIPDIIRIAETTWWSTYSPILPAEQIRYMLEAIYNPDTLRSQIKSGSQEYLILSSGAGPQAFISYSRRHDEGHIYKIHKLYVLPDNHNNGYGRALIEEIKSRLSGKNIHVLDLNVNRYNAARHFYEKVGFKIIREEDVPIGPYQMNDFVMRLEF